MRVFRKWWKLLAAVLTTGCIVTGAVLLPPALARREDQDLIGVRKSQPMEATGGYRYQPTLLEKLTMLNVYSQQNERSPSGNELTMEQAVARAQEELTNLQKWDILPECQVDWTSGSIQADFYEVSYLEATPAMSWTYWTIECRTHNGKSGFSWRVWMDAVSGKIYGVRLAGVWRDNPISLDASAQGMARYHELGGIVLVQNSSYGPKEGNESMEETQVYLVDGQPIVISLTAAYSPEDSNRQYYFTIHLEYSQEADEGAYDKMMSSSVR
jgi:hypothetical protein